MCADERDCEKKLEKAGHLIDLENYESAISLLHEIESEHRDELSTDDRLDALLHSYLGLANYHTEQLETAVQQFTIALKMRPEAENILFMRAKSLDFLGRLEEAKRDYLKVISINPNADGAHCFLGLIAESDGDLGEAVEYYSKALLVNSNDELSAKRLAIINEDNS